MYITLLSVFHGRLEERLPRDPQGSYPIKKVVVWQLSRSGDSSLRASGKARESLPAE